MRRVAFFVASVLWADPRPVPADARFAGAAACATCHRAESGHQSASAMAHALEPVAKCNILRTHPKLVFDEGGVHSEIVREGDRSILTVSKGDAKLSAPLLWAFGQGQAGQTYVFQHDGSLYESRLSFYEATGGLDLTMGAQNIAPATIEEFAGRKMDRADTNSCFGCHTTGAIRQDGVHWDALVPGVACEGCHGPAGEHVASQARMPSLAKMSTEEISDFCGGCHRTWGEISVNGPRGLVNVRFQPYRLTNSKCYDAADRRIRCVACHDPHGPLVKEEASYDAKCLACHRGAGTICPVAKEGCVGCHMARIELPGAHYRFTDHRIRVVRAGEQYPE